jgi:uncharacterized protein (DUF433 family)
LAAPPATLKPKNSPGRPEGFSAESILLTHPFTPLRASPLRLEVQRDRRYIIGMSIQSMIETTPGVCGGLPRIAGTRVPVHRVARYHRLGYSPEEMLSLLNSLSLPQIHAALAHALANPEETDRAIQEEEAAAAQLAAAHQLE